MSVPTNTFQTFTQKNIREDLIDAVYNVDPFKTPFLNMARKAKAKQTNHEWDTDSLAAQNLNNAAVEGDDPTPQNIAPTARMGNYTQISTKTVSISGTSETVIAAGGTNKMGYQLMKKSKELKRDMEGILTQNAAKNAGSSTTARLLAGLPCWLQQNVVMGAGGANPAVASNGWTDGTNIRTYGSTSTVMESNVKKVLQKCYKSSGDCPEYALVSSTNKQNISAFAGNGTRFNQVQDKRLRTVVDVYESDFGDVKMVPDIFLAHPGDIFFINPNYVRVAYLRPFQTIPLAKTGDSTKKLLLVEYTLQMGNEHAHGAIYDTDGTDS